MSVRVIENLAELDRLADAWESLERRSARCSLFDSFLYNRLAWQFFHTAADRLFVLVVEQGGRIVGIAPWVLLRRRYWGMPVRILRFIAEWEGDRPQVIAEDVEAAWAELCRFLESRSRDWDLLSLAEQQPDSPLLHLGFDDRRRYYCESGTDTYRGFASRAGGWERYLAARQPKVRKTWRMRTKKLAEAFGEVRLVCVEDPRHILDAWQRYQAVENRSWKARCRAAAAAKDARHEAFYRALLPALAERGETAICFLNAGGSDLAAAILFRWRQTVYGRHIVYDERYASYSPGILLETRLLHSFFHSSFEVFDFLGMRTPPGAHVLDWATDLETTRYRRVYRRDGRLWAWVLAKSGRAALCRAKTAHASPGARLAP